MMLKKVPASKRGARFLKALACTALLASSVSFADDSQTTWFGEVADGQWLAGIKLGVAEVDLASIEGANYDSAEMVTFVFGYQFSRPVGDNGTSSVEIEFGSTNDADIGRGGGVNGVGSWDMHTVGVFFNYRSPGTVYFKGKLGAIDSNIDSRFSANRTIKSDDASLALGLGAGIRLGGRSNNFNLEGEWVTATGDNDVNYFNVGGTVEF